MNGPIGASYSDSEQQECHTSEPQSCSYSVGNSSLIGFNEVRSTRTLHGISEDPHDHFRNPCDTCRIKSHPQADVEKRAGKYEDGGYVLQYHAVILSHTSNGPASSHRNPGNRPSLQESSQRPSQCEQGWEQSNDPERHANAKRHRLSARYIPVLYCPHGQQRHDRHIE